MVQRCCVPLCDTKVGDVDIKGSKVRFHRIPLTPEKFRRWKDKITDSGKFEPEPDLTINSRICSKHFLREDYISDANIQDKPGTPGNHILGKDATPSIFKWNDSSGNDCEISRAIPYVKKVSSMNDSGECKCNQEIQCSLLEEKLRQEIYRKNLVIQQLLQRLAEVEKSDSDNKEDNSSSSNQNSSDSIAEKEMPESGNVAEAEDPPVPASEELLISKRFISKATNTDDDGQLVQDKPTMISTAQQTDLESFTIPTCIPVQVIKRVPRQIDLKLPPKKRKIHEH